MCAMETKFTLALKWAIKKANQEIKNLNNELRASIKEMENLEEYRIVELMNKTYSELDEVTHHVKNLQRVLFWLEQKPEGM